MPEQTSHGGEQQGGEIHNAIDTPDDLDNDSGEEVAEQPHEAEHGNVRERRDILNVVIDQYAENPEVLREINRFRQKPKDAKRDESNASSYLLYTEQFPPIKERTRIAAFFKKIEAGISLWTSDSDIEDSDRRKILVEATVSHRVMLFSNLGLVHPIARRNTFGILEVEDVFEEGLIGLHNAIAGFDYTKGFEFSTYATHKIYSHIRREVANQSRLVRGHSQQPTAT